jgi:transcriptional regulator with XRE-family HTH domain
MKKESREFVRLLKTANWSQADAARKLQITPGAVSQICSGTTRPRPVTLKLLRVLVAQKLAASQPKPRERLRLNPGEREFFYWLNKLPPTVKDALLTAFQRTVHGLLLQSVEARQG